MDELDKLENSIKTGKPDRFIRNCFCCVRPDFIECCETGKTEIVRWMIEHGADVNSRDDWALRLSSGHGHTETVKLLLEWGADVHANGDWALRSASMNGHTETVKLLLEGGADVHADDDFALRWASEKGHTEVVKLLKEWIENNKIL